MPKHVYYKEARRDRAYIETVTHPNQIKDLYFALLRYKMALQNIIPTGRSALTGEGCVLRVYQSRPYQGAEILSKLILGHLDIEDMLRIQLQSTVIKIVHITLTYKLEILVAMPAVTLLQVVDQVVVSQL